MMLENAKKYQKAFERLEEEDPNYLRTIRDEAKEKGNDRHEVAWGMDDVNWEKIRIFLKFLKIFYDATLWFSSANYVTSNFFFYYYFFWSSCQFMTQLTWIMKKMAIC